MTEGVRRDGQPSTWDEASSRQSLSMCQEDQIPLPNWFPRGKVQEAGYSGKGVELE